MTLFQISCLITSLISFLFGFFVFLSNRKSNLSRLWFLTSVAISVWSLGFFGVVFSDDYSSAWFSQYFLDIAGILVPIFLLGFIIELISGWDKHKKFFILSLFIGFFLIALNFTPLFKEGMIRYQNFNYWVNPGPFYFLFPLSFLILSIYSFVLLFKTYRKNIDNVLKAQIRYVIFAQIFGFGGGVTNFFPQLFNIYPFGNYLVILYIYFISYAILKHHLFNVRVIATELFTLIICIVLIIRTLLSENFYELITNSIIAISVAVFGVLLIRSVLKEVRQREQLELLSKKVQQAYEVEKRAHEELAKLDEAKTQFMMATQHHLRTPLTSIRGYLDLLLTGTYGKIPKKVRETLVKLQISSNRLIRIVNEFLDASQFQLGKDVVSIQPGVDIMPVINEIMEELNFEAETKGIYLKLEKPAKIPKIKADSEKLKIALFNLFDNGIKYTSKGGVTIKLSVEGNKFKITIKDTGVGITKEDLGNLFNRVFERGQNAQKINGTGRGIGLYIASHIIKSHNGKVWAESEGKEKGSTFYIELPIN